VVLKQRGAARVQKKIILCVYGISWEGQKEMIDFLLATSESQNAWEGFLRDLYGRGLEGKGCELITTDGGSGLRNALEVVYPRIPRQHCSEIDDLLSFYQVKLSAQERQGLDAKEIQKAQIALWRKIRTTNLIERAFREVKRRTRPMGVFGNRDSMERILYAVFFHYNSKGQEIPSLLFTQNA
jgi:transposase-like protein